MANVLLVSDNPGLTEYVRVLVSGPEFRGVKVDFRYSSVNKNPNAMRALGCSEIDLKDPVQADEAAVAYSCILSLHCKQIFPATLVRRVRCINVHPGLNPYNRGWFPQAFSILNGLPAGVTIHEMDEQVDHGGIIVQQEVPVADSDTSETAYRKIVDTEKLLLKDWLFRLVEGDYMSRPMADEGNYNGIADFNALRALDLDHVGSLREHLALLRALTHPPYWNAYYDDEQGNTVEVRIELKTKR